jgi:vanillate O-demethylase ferredoxin subunit
MRSVTTGQTLFDVAVVAVTHEARDVNLYALESAHGESLPAFTAGAHIDVLLDAGLIRQYSLLNSPADPSRYWIGVMREEGGGGGSRFLHEQVHQGTRLQISAPRNHFSLVEDAGNSVLIAAGIGITPIWSMVQRLSDLGQSWELHYGARTRMEAALLGQLEAFACGSNGKIHLYFSREPNGGRLPLAGIVAAAPANSHIYACGPRGLLEEFEQLPIAPSQARHVEHFTPIHEAAHDGGFTIVLARSGRVIHVPSGATILEALKANNIAASYSCTKGICGQCETTVLRGTPDHRDSILTESERAANKTMMICCSGSRSDELVLDM